jgi:hypothetical protein
MLNATQQANLWATHDESFDIGVRLWYRVFGVPCCATSGCVCGCGGGVGCGSGRACDLWRREWRSSICDSIERTL